MGGWGREAGGEVKESLTANMGGRGGAVVEMFLFGIACFFLSQCLGYQILSGWSDLSFKAFQKLVVVVVVSIVNATFVAAP